MVNVYLRVDASFVSKDYLFFPFIVKFPHHVFWINITGIPDDVITESSIYLRKIVWYTITEVIQFSEFFFYLRMT